MREMLRRLWDYAKFAVGYKGYGGIVLLDNFQHLIQAGSLHVWLYIPTAILLGALHGLEPGHSKTLMAAFMVAIRGTIAQAVLLGVCAAFSHSLVIWLLAAAALHYGSSLNAESSEPYFQLFSAVVILGLALWMAWRTWRDIHAEAHHHHGHDHGHGHGVACMDLARTRLAKWAIWLLTTVIYREPMALHDARLSARRAFSTEELRTLAENAGWNGFKHRKFLCFQQGISSELKR